MGHTGFCSPPPLAGQDATMGSLNTADPGLDSLPLQSALPWGEPKRLPLALVVCLPCHCASVGRAGSLNEQPGALRQPTSEPKVGARSGQGRSPPGGTGVAPPSTTATPAPPSAPSSRDPRGGSVASEERPLLADKRGMSSGGSRHVMRRRSSSSPSRGSNFQPPPWEQRRAHLHRQRVRSAAGGGPAGRRPAAPRRVVLGLSGIQVGAGGGCAL